MTAFIDEEISRGELALWGSPLRFSSLKRLQNVFVRGVRIILFIMEKGFKLNAAKKFFNILLNGEFVMLCGCRNKIQALTEDGFLCVGKRKILGIVITVLRLSSDESQVIGGPVNCSSFWA